MNSRFFQPGRSGYGFTLVELLVVIAIIGVLIALLLPAVQAARAAARRAQCKTNLKQINLAVHSYISAHAGELPPGGVRNGRDTRSPDFESWSISILPYLELQNLYDQYDFDEYNLESENVDVLTTIVPVYLCPSDEDTLTLERPESGRPERYEMARGSYRANTGRCGHLPAGRTGWWDNPPQTEIFKKLDMLHWKGPFHVVNNLFPHIAFIPKLKEITDGQSNTFFLGEGTSKSSQGEEFEKRRNRKRRTFWAYSYTSYNKSCAMPQSRTLLSDFSRCVDVRGLGESNTCKRAWGSLHPDGIHFSYGDGSVHLIARSIDMKIFAERATMAGDELIN